MTIKQIRIAILKRRLRAAYLEYMSAADDLYCGRAMAEIIRPGIAGMRDNCNALLGKLARLDPENCPISRIT